MSRQHDLTQLVELARSGRRDALNQLAEVVQAPLRSYVLRITFRHQQTDDIVQETLLEMFGIIGQLKRADHFWPWLCKIALNKARNQTRTETRRRELLHAHAIDLASKSAPPDGVAAVVYDEFKQCIFEAMAQLSERQRAIISLRCYEKMSYAQIAEVMGGSELGCRLLFLRTKKKLQGKLSRLGYGRGSLLTALVLLGKLTAPNAATAAQVCIAPALLSGGALAGGIVLLTGKLAITAGLVAAAIVGLVAVAHQPAEAPSPDTFAQPFSVTADQAPASSSHHIHEGYYFFPGGKDGPVLTRLVVHQAGRVLQVLQNGKANYTYAPASQTVHVNNHYYWNPDLGVTLLPTDGPELAALLLASAQPPAMRQPSLPDSPNLFIAIAPDATRSDSFVAHNYQALLEERFQYSWPAGAVIEDNRDALHRRGWCYFTIEGQLHGRRIEGRGRLPLIYDRAAEQPPWLMVTIAAVGTLIDTPTGATQLDAAGAVVATYPPGTFLRGLNRPWDGLHVVDTVRRDAAHARLPFETALNADRTLARVRLRPTAGLIEYALDMEKDWIRQVRFVDAGGVPVGALTFSYVAPDAVKTDDTFAAPRPPFGARPRDAAQVHWLAALLGGNL